MEMIPGEFLELFGLSIAKVNRMVLAFLSHLDFNLVRCKEENIGFGTIEVLLMLRI